MVLNTFITFVFFDTCAIKHRLGHVSIGNKGLKNSLFGFAKECEFQIRPLGIYIYIYSGY